MATTATTPISALKRKIKTGDMWAVVVYCERTKPTSIEALLKAVYGATTQGRVATSIPEDMFDRIADGFDVYLNQGVGNEAPHLNP